MTNAATTQVTVEEFLKLPDPPQGHLELHHGEPVIVPPPKKPHTNVQIRLVKLLGPLVGETFALAMEFPFEAPDNEFWVADIAILSLERWKEETPDNYFHGAPELVVEVSSPGNTWDELIDKGRVCLANGCVSFWIVDPKHREVHVTDIHRNTVVYAGDMLVPLSPLPGSISVRDIFGI
jgi:Uma2 family endonuclease